MVGQIQLQHGLQALVALEMLGLRILLNGMTEMEMAGVTIRLELPRTFVPMTLELQLVQLKAETDGAVSTLTVMVASISTSLWL